MSIDIHIKRMQIFAQIIYEITVSGNINFEKRYVAALENTLDIDLPGILDLCLKNKGLIMENISKVTIEYSLTNVIKSYIVEYKPEFKDAFTVYVKLNKIEKIYVFPFDDTTQKDDIVLNVFFDEWNKSVKYLQKVCAKQSAPNIAADTSSLIDKETLYVDEKILVNNKTNTMMMGIVSRGRAFQMCISWKGVQHYFDFEDRNIDQYPLNAAYFLRKIPFDKNILKVKSVILLLKYSGSVMLVFNRKNSIQQFMVVIKDRTIGTVPFNSKGVNEKIKNALSDYPDILSHISDWCKTFKYIDRFFSSYFDSSINSNVQQSHPNIDYKPCHIDISEDKHGKILKWQPDLKRLTYVLIAKSPQGKISKICYTKRTKYTVKNSDCNNGNRYAVYATSIPLDLINIDIQDKDFYPKYPLIAKPAQSIHSIKVGDVYYNKSTTPCGHRFWKVIEAYPNTASIKCTQCKLLRNISVAELNNEYSFSYSNPPAETVRKQCKITSADVIVLSSSKRCTAQRHKVEDYIGLLPVVTKFGCNKIEINVSYCKDCDRFTMLKSDYLKIIGTPVCEVRDLSTNRIINHSADDFFGETKEHKLHRLGYNVRFGNGMSNFDRQQLLAQIINNRDLSRDEIISHIEYCININSNKANMDSAVRKWKADLEFLYNFKPNAEKIAINSLTLKYNKAKR